MVRAPISGTTGRFQARTRTCTRRRPTQSRYPPLEGEEFVLGSDRKREYLKLQAQAVGGVGARIVRRLREDGRISVPTNSPHFSKQGNRAEIEPDEPERIPAGHARFSIPAQQPFLRGSEVDV